MSSSSSMLLQFIRRSQIDDAEREALYAAVHDLQDMIESADERVSNLECIIDAFAQDCEDLRQQLETAEARLPRAVAEGDDAAMIGMEFILY